MFQPFFVNLLLSSGFLGLLSFPAIAAFSAHVLHIRIAGTSPSDRNILSGGCKSTAIAEIRQENCRMQKSSATMSNEMPLSLFSCSSFSSC